MNAFGKSFFLKKMSLLIVFGLWKTLFGIIAKTVARVVKSAGFPDEQSAGTSFLRNQQQFSNLFRNLGFYAKIFHEG